MSTLVAQAPLDSLKEALLQATEDVQKVRILMGIGNERLDQDIEEATAYYDEAFVLASRLNDKTSLNDLGMAYNILAGSYGDLGNINRSKNYYQKALRIFKNIENPYAVATLSANLGDIYLEQDSNLLAEQFYLQALPVLDAAGDRESYLQVQLKRAINLSQQRQFRTLCALIEPLENELLASGDLHERQTIYALLSDAYAGRKKHYSAYIYSVKAAMTSDSIWIREIQDSKEMLREMDSLCEEKVKEIELKNPQLPDSQKLMSPEERMWIRGLIFGGIVLSLLLIIIALQAGKIRSQKRLIDDIEA